MKKSKHEGWLTLRKTFTVCKKYIFYRSETPLTNEFFSLTNSGNLKDLALSFSNFLDWNGYCTLSKKIKGEQRSREFLELRPYTTVQKF